MEPALPPLLSLAEVEALARRVHSGQTDKAGRPYAEHLAAVASGVRERGGSDEQIAAAWLHDAVEDGALSKEWLAGAALSEAVKAMILAVTKRAGEPVEEYTARILATPGRCWSRRPIWRTTPIRTGWPYWTRRRASG